MTYDRSWKWVPKWAPVFGVLSVLGCGAEGTSLLGDGGITGNSDALGFGFADGSIKPATCQVAKDCGSNQLCHPYSHQCVTSGASCTNQSSCTNGTYCDSDSHVCLPGTTGAPCASALNCGSAACMSNVCGCSALAHERQLVAAPLDIYFIFDRTASMGQDCNYTPGGNPPVNSKACFATYALPDYLINTTPAVDTRLAFQFMSLPGDSCNGTAYATPRIALTKLPVTANHQLISTISNEDFSGGYGTEIEGALRGIAQYTAGNRTQGREMIGVLMTDGDPNGCSNNIGNLRSIVANHFTATGIRTFIIGMEGATGSNLEQLASAGGAKPHSDWCGDVSAPCHYWNVGDGSGDAIASALQAIVMQAAPLPCDLSVAGLKAPQGQTIDFGKVNVTLTDASGTMTTIGQVANAAACPMNQPAWYYDNPTSPKTIHMCPAACSIVSKGTGSKLHVVVGCQNTVIIN